MTTGFDARKAARILSAIALAATLATAAEAAAGTPAEPVAVAVLDFDYFDTSEEPRDQAAEHAARLDAFMSALRRDLEQGGGYRVVALACGAQPCTVRSLPPEELFEVAKKAGARLLLYGGVHKMSTLVQWAQTQLVDVERNRLVDDRRLSFRGDDDESWRRAEAHLVDKLVRLQTQKTPQ